MYSLHYDMIVKVLQQFNYSGEVHADIFPCAEIRKGGRTILTVQNGSVVSCIILNKSGQKLSYNIEAYYVIKRLGVLDWRLVSVASLSSISPPHRSSIEAPVRAHEGPFPRHRVVSPTQMQTWSMFYRSVYSLCDGTHSNELIATLLSRPPDSVEKVIQDLIDADAIESVS